MGLTMKRKVWIDIENSPHVLFFNPIIKELKIKGFSIMVTARSYAQISGLLKLYKIDAKMIGRHYGKNKIFKIFGLFIRSLQLLFYALKSHPDIAFSHYSRSQLLSAKILRIPTIIAYDYEYVQSLVFFNPDLFLVPEVLFKAKRLSKNKGFSYYPGMKENVYMENEYYDNYLAKYLGLNNSDIIITIRPPASEAHYYNKKSSELFDLIVYFLVKIPETKLVILPRTLKQKLSIIKKFKNYIDCKKIVIPQSVIDCNKIINLSDLVISGGGTMIREAASIDVPAYSYFCGKIGAVDNELIRQKKLVHIKHYNDIKTNLKIKKHQNNRYRKTYINPTIESLICHVEKLAS